jgi:hypothetical protein
MVLMVCEDRMPKNQNGLFVHLSPVSIISIGTGIGLPIENQIPHGISSMLLVIFP